MMHTLVLFDIDGTLLNSSSAGRRAIQRAFAAEFADLAFFTSVRFDGKTDPQIVAELYAAAGQPERATPERTAQLLESYVDHLAAEVGRADHRVRALPGVAPLLDALHATAGVCVGLLTGNIVGGARLKLGAAGLPFERFRLGAFGSDSSRRPDLPAIAAERAMPIFGRVPRGAEVVIIGDTPADVTCGEGIGARAVAVATGAYDGATLSAAGAAAVFDDLSATDDVLEAILCSNSN
ncbi:MAG: haloacid dehalogenase-like hydrolase [Gemmatimonadales bacterium]|nr:haloacid dehalogenase-like hydrolase [Gemmatimonadales bacterium]MDZ4389342.1 haloacid dehalogenase-like hydrolase [Gemmatimonadales bacterium]